jgi:hypothetical protein
VRGQPRRMTPEDAIPPDLKDASAEKRAALTYVV